MKFAFFLVFAVLFSFSVSAEILISQPQAVYNLGDKFDMKINLLSQSEKNEFVNSKLACPNGDVDLLKSPYFVEAGVQKEISLSTKFSKTLIGDLKGECYLEVRFDNEEIRSQKFEISDEIMLTFNIDNVLLNPGDSVNVKGSAKKANGQNLNGFLEAEVKGIDFKVSGLVNNGEFDFSFSMPLTSSSGTYELRAKAYEKDDKANIINSGESVTTLKIKQIMKEIGIALNVQSVSPSSEVKYTVVMHDQADEDVSADVAVIISDPSGNIFEKNVVRTGQSQVITTERNTTPGEWKIEAKLDNLTTVKSFLVEEYRGAVFNVSNSTLIITNVGNVPYTGPVKISLGEIDEIKEINNLAVGDSKKFKLVAPPGSYKVSVDDGSTKADLGEVALVGRAVDIQDIASTASENWLVWVWLLLILAIAVVAVVLYKKISKERTLSGGRLSIKELFGSLFKKSKTVQLSPQKMSEVKTTEGPGLIDKGEREEASVACLKIKNLKTLSESHQEGIKIIDGLLNRAKEMGAKVYSDENHRIIVLTPMLTKEKDNSAKLVNIADNICRKLKEHNKRYSMKIEFGIGLNVGNLIVESAGDKFKFVSVDNTINSTKRIAEIANEEVLMTENVHKRVVGKVKTSKLHDRNLWKIEKIADRSQHEEFISRFKQRNKHN